MFHTDSSLNWKAIGKRHSLLNESDYQQNTCLNLDSCWKLERGLYTRQWSHKTRIFWIGTRRNTTWSVKIDILNWIMLHADSGLNWRAIGNKTFTREMKLLSTEHLFEPRWLLETREGSVYKTVIAQNTAFLNRNKGEYDVKCKDRRSQLDNVSYRQ